MARFALITLIVAGSLSPSPGMAGGRPDQHPLIARYCNECHSKQLSEGGLDFSQLGTDLEDAATFARWERIFDRLAQNEMPPPDADQPTAKERQAFTGLLQAKLVDVHAKHKGTVLRRLNRREYQNTLNDLFGTNLKLAGMLPEDGRTQEFDNVGKTLGLSLVHLQKYLDAANLVFATAIANTTNAPQAEHIKASYLETPEAERFVGKKWKQLDDGAIVRFSQGGYPSGMMRGTNVRKPGRYRVRVTGYAHQSKSPITFSVGGTSFARGSTKPIYGFWSFPAGAPGQTHTIEFDTWIEKNYMVAIEPYGIRDPDRYQRESIADYRGPGLAILNVTLDGPLIDQWPSPGHRLIFDGLNRREIEPRNPADKQKRWYRPKFEIISENEEREVRAVLQRIAEVAFRRPPQPSDIERYTQLFVQERQAGSTTERALQTAATAIFCSAKFLYLQEPTGKLDGYALASRLSYFMTRSGPDADLLALAESGQLVTDATLRSETERLLQSPHFDRFLTDFTDNWLDLRDMDFTMPDRSLFPEFDSYLRFSMPLETRQFLRELIDSNLPVSNLVKSDFAMLNSRLAEHYGLPSVNGAEIRKVALPRDSLRGGFLAQASVLKVTANGTNTSPVKRGAWVLERMFDLPPPPPPPGIPGVEPDIRGASTLRQLLTQHRNLASCNACHEKIDPPGFALEAFNPIGGYRERYRSLGNGERVDRMVDGRKVAYRLGPQVDSSGKMPGGGTFQDFRQFRDALAADPRPLAKAMTKKLLVFATGRELGFSDRAEVDRIVTASERHGYRIRDLIHLVVQSDLFRTK